MLQRITDAEEMTKHLPLFLAGYRALTAKTKKVPKWLTSEVLVKLLIEHSHNNKSYIGVLGGTACCFYVDITPEFVPTHFALCVFQYHIRGKTDDLNALLYAYYSWAREHNIQHCQTIVQSPNGATLRYYKNLGYKKEAIVLQKDI